MAVVMVAAKQTPAYVFHANFSHVPEVFGLPTCGYTTVQQPQWRIGCKENKKRKTSKAFPYLFSKMS